MIESETKKTRVEMLSQIRPNVNRSQITGIQKYDRSLRPTAGSREGGTDHDGWDTTATRGLAPPGSL